MKNYTKFASEFTNFLMGASVGMAENKGPETTEHFIKRIGTTLERCKIFEITDSMKTLLALTNPPKNNDFIHLPFPIIFIDVGFTQEELKKIGIDFPYNALSGILVHEQGILVTKEGVFLDESEIKTKQTKCLRYTVMVNETELGRDWEVFKDFATNYDFPEEVPEDIKDKLRNTVNPYITKKTTRFVQGFTLNVLNLLYDPEVEYVMTEPDKVRNKKRESKGKWPIPGRLIIKVKGELKVYLNKINKIGINHYTHSFWVRGHYRTLRHERYKENIGKRIWVVPYIKGEGILINREYEVDKTKKSLKRVINSY